MADPRSAHQQAMAWQADIRGFANQGQSASQAVQSLAAVIEKRGGTLGFRGYIEAQRIFGQWTKVRNASRVLAQAPNDYAVTGDMMAQLPYGHNPSATGGPRQWHVRVSYTAILNGVESERSVVLKYTSVLPATVGELRAEADAFATARADEYGETVAAMGGIEIGEL